MRRPFVSLVFLTVAFAVAAGAAVAQQAEAPVSTSDQQGWVDPNAKAPPPGRAITVPAPKTLYKGPFERLADLPRQNLLTNVHGSVGVMVGSHSTRAFYADVHGDIGDNAAFDLRFSTIHSDGLPIYDGPYAGGYGGYGGYGAPYPGYGPRYGSRYSTPYGYGAGTSYSVGAALRLGDPDSRYDRVWPNYFPPPATETTTDVTDDPMDSSSR